jgi:hypothetical protein
VHRFLPGCSLLVLAVLAPSMMHARATGRSHSACSAPPLAAVAADRSAYQTETLSQGTFIDTIVRGLIPRVAEVESRGRRYRSWFAACGSRVVVSPIQLMAGVRRLGLSPKQAADAFQAAVRYPFRMWGAYGWGRFIPAGVSRGQVDGAQAWIFILVGPQPVDWRYAVVRDSDQVLAWELTGDDARRLFHTGASEGGPT